MMIKYSVIMPIFNAIEFIEKNLNMFKDLNRNDIELIIINDGSKDGSKEIVNQYQKDIKNLILINQENKGISYSRNVGIKKANGKYITFLDCDDSIEEDFFDKMDTIYNEEYDLIRYGINIVNKKRNQQQKLVYDKVVYKNFSQNKERYRLVYITNKMNTACNQIIRTQILKENEIFFDVNHKYAEDFEFNRKLANYINTTCFLPECFYNYYMNDNGTSRTVNRNNVMKCIMDSIEIHTQTYYECKEKSEDMLEDTFKNISLEFMTSIRRIFFVPKIKIKEMSNLFTKLASLDEIKFLSNEKNKNNWKSNLFIDHCLYKSPNYIEILFFKYYFILKRFIKKVLY